MYVFHNFLLILFITAHLPNWYPNENIKKINQTKPIVPTTIIDYLGYLLTDKNIVKTNLPLVISSPNDSFIECGIFEG